MSEKEEKKDPFDGEYIGNIWGWKFSIFGAVLILLLLAVIAYRHYTLDVPIGLEDPLEQEGNSADSTAADTTGLDPGR
ncbi:MAG: hypothetical protein J5I94_20525 [Phaeodactylibacter sp.]|nr:hypothetical protein [Phaeodactylibacter sp.]